MSSMRICWFVRSFRPPHYAEQFCIDIPIPIPIPELPGPRPEPWLHGENINAKVAHDLSIIATIERLSRTLGSTEIKESFGTTINSAIDRLDLPPEVSITLDGHVIREHCVEHE